MGVNDEQSDRIELDLNPRIKRLTAELESRRASEVSACRDYEEIVYQQEGANERIRVLTEALKMVL